MTIQKGPDDDREIQALLETELKQGRLVDVLVDLLSSSAGSPEIRINGVAVPLAAPQPPISDKSCYKKCLKDSLGKPDPDAFYRQCIKKCKPKFTLAVEIET